MNIQDPKLLKLYIAVLDEVPDHMVPTLVAHTILNAHRNFASYSLVYNDWLDHSFKKVVLRVNRKEFAKINELTWVHRGCESTVLNGETSCIVVCPRHTNHKVLTFAKMWKPTYN